MHKATIMDKSVGKYKGNFHMSQQLLSMIVASQLKVKVYMGSTIATYKIESNQKNGNNQNTFFNILIIYLQFCRA